MRVCGLLLVAATVSTTIGDAAVHDPSLLKTISTEDKSSQAFTTPRFLRSLSTTMEKRNDDKDNEERGLNFSKVVLLDDATDKNMSYMISMFQKWDTMKADDIALSVANSGITRKEAVAMVTMYNKYKEKGAAVLLAELKASVSK
ncbi:RxLR effector protein [Phytophthora megakarya]|uniref:RxLR effector protein n=1 Tax=Phytophthora megakarya TaxID=4795 RepID=A0A225W9L5_9STRA|nr:RxLR effector protein [Phytophthora megakarya]